MNEHVAIGRDQMIAGQNVCAAQLFGSIIALRQKGGSRINVLIEARAQQGQQPAPLWRVGRSINPAIETARGAEFEQDLLVGQTLDASEIRALRNGQTGQPKKTEEIE